MSDENAVVEEQKAAVETPAVQSVLLRLRKERGLTQGELQKQLGVSYNTIAFAERGLVLSKKTAQKLSAFFGIAILPIVSARRKATAKRKLEALQAAVAAADQKAEVSLSANAPEVVNGAVAGSENLSN